jgi:hypothetical protein
MPYNWCRAHASVALRPKLRPFKHAVMHVTNNPYAVIDGPSSRNFLVARVRCEDGPPRVTDLALIVHGR